MNTYPSTERTTVRRLPKRAVTDKSQVHAILDEGYICHVGFAIEGQPYVIPTGYVRVDEQVYLHGSAASRMLRTLHGGIDVCVTITLLDGFVLARSAFHHSMNYRSVVLLGKARLVEGNAEKLEALHRFTNHIVPGRWEEVRQPTEQELKATIVLALRIQEISAKVRMGPPIDDDADYLLPVWAGVIPLQTTAGQPVADVRILPGLPSFDGGRLPTSISNRK